MRPSWNQYFAEIAKVVATRSTCPRLSVGCVIVKDKTILSTGYNGSLNNAPHCDKQGCIIQDDHCIATTHAELNALLQAARLGIATAYSTAYITHRPCLPCFKALYQAGIKRIVYIQDYRNVDYGKALNLPIEILPDVSKL